MRQERLRLLATADLHGNIGLYRELAAVADSIEPHVIVIAGDLLPRVDPSVPLAEAVGIQEPTAREIDDILHSTGIPTIYTLGNTDRGNPMFLHMKDLTSKCIEAEGVKIVGLSAISVWTEAPPRHSAGREQSEEEIEGVLRAFAGTEHPFVLVNHGPAYGLLDRISDKGSTGSRSIRRFLAENKPAAFICGHIHGQYGAVHFDRTWVFNAASAATHDALRAFVLDIDRHGVGRQQKISVTLTHMPTVSQGVGSQLVFWE